jgi:glycosyltransferase involved in cell wall biosynthesis
MRVLVCPHELEIGGSQINAIDLAAEIREFGHDAVVYGVPGPLVSHVEARGLPFVAAHPMQYRPAPTRIRQVLRIARELEIDLIHGYEWPPCLDAYYGAHLVGEVPVVCTVLSMSLTPLVPPSLPLIVGTRQLGAEAEAQRGGRVFVIEPPVDTELDHPGNDGSSFRQQHEIPPGDFLVVTVSRLSVDLKLDALIDAVDAMATLADRTDVHLVIVGGGEAAPHLQTRANAVNESVGRDAVKLVGPTLDARPAYAAADVVVGMGSSSLRAMAHGKPVVVQGERGFSLTFDDRSASVFDWQGYYGIGDGEPGGAALARQLGELLEDADLRRRLGRLGHETVEKRYSLRPTASRLSEVYEAALADGRPRRGRMTEAAMVGFRALANEVRLHRPSEKRARRHHYSGRLEEAACPRP